MEQLTYWTFWKKNYKSELSMQEIAYYTGRSLATTIVLHI